VKGLFVDGDELPQIKVYFVMRLTGKRRIRISLENENSPSPSAFYNGFKVELNPNESHVHPFFWVIPRSLYFMCRCFGTLCLFHLHKRCWGICRGKGVWLKNIFDSLNPVIIFSAYTAHEDGTECSKTSAHKIQRPSYHPKERIQPSEQGGSLKSRLNHICPTDLRKD
jgi:hypothetical protein